MKKICLIAATWFTATLFITCKKDPVDIPIGTIKVNIGTAEKTFNINAKATRLNVTNGHGIQIQGYFRTSSSTNLIFSIISPHPIISGTYIENPGSNPLVLMTHCVEVIFPCVFQTSAYGSLSNPVSITITEITSTYVKGNFKGELQSPGPSGGTPSNETFNNGVFYVAF